MGDTPTVVQVRIEGNEWRFDAIDGAATLYDCNRSDAIAYACEDIKRTVEAVEDVLNRDDLTPQQKLEIAETFNSKGVTVEIDETVSVDLG